MTNGSSGLESTLKLSQSKAEYVSHSHSYGFRIPTRVYGNGDVICILKTGLLWV
jgi:hypothetical protein